MCSPIRFTRPGARKIRAGLLAERLLKCFSYDVRFDSQSIHPPKIAITRPAYKINVDAS